MINKKNFCKGEKKLDTFHISRKKLFTSLCFLATLLGGCTPEKPPLKGMRLPFQALEKIKFNGSDEKLKSSLGRSFLFPERAPNDKNPSLALSWILKGDGGSVKHGNVPQVVFPPESQLFCLLSPQGNVVQYALDSLQGPPKKIWSFPLWNEQNQKEQQQVSLGGDLVWGKDALYVSTQDGALVCLSSKGKMRWRKNLPAAVRGGCCYDFGQGQGSRSGFLGCITLKNQLFWLEASSGRIIWSYQATNEDTSVTGGATPRVAKDTVLMGSSSGEVAALDTLDGSVIWAQNGAAASPGVEKYMFPQIKATPVIKGEQVYTISMNGQLTAFDLGTGQVLWRAPVGGMFAPVIRGDFLLGVDQGAVIYVLNRHKGDGFLSIPLPAGERIIAEPIWDGRYVYALTNRHSVHIFDLAHQGRLCSSFVLPSRQGRSGQSGRLFIQALSKNKTTPHFRLWAIDQYGDLFCLMPQWSSAKDLKTSP